MCGILAQINKSNQAIQVNTFQKALTTLHQRGPDYQGYYHKENIVFGHARLSIIDTTQGAMQPFKDASGRYVLVFNGEIYNYQNLKQRLIAKQYEFLTQSDTEVLLYWLIEYGTEGINELNGFFSFCFWDTLTNEFLVARDRYGIKPLLIFEDEQQIAIASEMKALLSLGIPKVIDWDSVHLYFKLNYIPQPLSIFKGVRKLKPGSYLKIHADFTCTEGVYYALNTVGFGSSKLDYEAAKIQLVDVLQESVDLRLIADVPLGCFLSGGIDSSVITALASRSKEQINTFSIGYKDEPFFDETHYAQLVAKKFNTNHTVFSLSNDDLFNQLFKMLDYTDEPFADSSGLAVNILSEQTKKSVTVALSGDGADELFTGYRKHHALYWAQQSNVKNQLVKLGAPIWEWMPKSRNSKIGDVVRKLDKFSKGLNLSAAQRYWLWAGFLSESECDKLLLKPKKDYTKTQAAYMEMIGSENDFNAYLYADFNLVLAGDMLPKVDLNSMCHSLEVRVPFLDYKVVDFAFSLPVKYKIDGKHKKIILQDAFKSILPPELYHRPKKGFEVPLLNWLRNELSGVLFDKYLHPKYIQEQGVFNLEYIQSLKKQLYSNSPGDSVATLWALLVFQHWYQKFFN